MLADSRAFSGFAVKDLDEARAFYADTLGLRTTVLDERNGLMQLELAGERNTLVYRQPDCTPASYTILNFPVDDIEATVDELTSRGVVFEQYGEPFNTDARGIARLGDTSGAWFKDPDGNALMLHRRFDA